MNTTQAIQTIAEKMLPWFLDHGLKIIIIIVIAYFTRRSVGILVDRIIRRVITESNYLSRDAEKKREDTLIRIFSVAIGLLIWVIAILMSLQEAGFDITPLLAAAGIAGLAFGFGGQYVIRDLISGLFIILENQYRIGDVVSFSDISGTVEDISLRMTTIRDLDGTVHHIPHGEIKLVSNLTKSFARVNLDIGISYSANLEHVISVVNKVGQELAEDSEWKDQIITPPQFLRVSDFADSSIIIKILGDTKPLKQWAVAGELRKRIKIAFDKENIEIPFPQMVVHRAKD